MTKSTLISDQVRLYVAEAIARKEWRSACATYCTSGLRDGRLRNAIEAYVRAEYEKAGAGYAGRWQT